MLLLIKLAIIFDGFGVPNEKADKQRWRSNRLGNGNEMLLNKSIQISKKTHTFLFLYYFDCCACQQRKHLLFIERLWTRVDVMLLVLILEKQDKSNYCYTMIFKLAIENVQCFYRSFWDIQSMTRVLCTSILNVVHWHFIKLQQLNSIPAIFIKCYYSITRKQLHEKNLKNVQKWTAFEQCK